MAKTLAIQPKGRGRRVEKKRVLWRRPAGIVLGVVFVALGLRAVVVQAYRAPSRSMEDTLQVGDCVLVDKLRYGAVLPFVDWRLPAIRSPRVGEIVVFKYPADPQRLYVKRCLAVEGQVVEIRDKVVYVDGVRQIDPPFSKYVDARIFSAATAPRDNWDPREVPPGTIFLLGDNRDNSRDSRHWGFLPLDLVVGKALCVYWSTAPAVPAADSWLIRLWRLPGRVRWHRVGTWVQ
jgi:signal peptidase I